ncbi:zinc dependent phospholipase C family protein [Desulfovibrio sp. OttesenSCG-928-O18]|nr:zinc dependent phospholipase C family protein [Desulfovibrio sp. OttesenSCG-928-O18]
MARLLFVIALAAASFALVLLAPEAALAWGPGAHMVTGNWILQNLAVLPAFVAEPLMRYPGLFLQGCLSADIFIGKGSKPKKGHSHNWESGFALLEKARSPSRQAYAYGYLAHLAADTVAHNVFVPYLLPIAPGNGKMAHVYLEMQADRLLDWDKADALAVFHERGSGVALTMLRKTLRRNTLKFRLQSGVYRGSIAVGGSAVWRRSLTAVDRLLPESVRLSWLDNLLAVATRAAVDVLRNGESSQVLNLDPIGAAALASAVKVRSAQSFFPGSARARACLAALPETLPDALESLPVVCVGQGQET